VFETGARELIFLSSTEMTSGIKFVTIRQYKNCFTCFSYWD